MVIWFSIRGRIFPKGGEMMRSILWTSPVSRVRSASDTCNIYFTYTKVNHLLYTCSLDPFEDGILLDTSPVCMHRYFRSFTDVEEECKRQGTTTPSAREAWKRRRKKELRSLQRPDDRKPPDVRHSPALGRPTSTGRPTRPRQDQPGDLQRPDDRQPSDDR